MAIRGIITLTDGAATPVNRVYSPVKFVNDILTWLDRTQSVLLGQNKLTCFQRLADRQTQATKVVWKLEMPILAQTSGGTSAGLVPNPKVAYSLLATVDFVLPAQSAMQERKDLLFMLRDLLEEAVVTSQIVDGDMIY